MTKIHTACKDCIFAQYEDKTQTGCSFGRIEKFRNTGVEVIEVYDDDKEFFVIDGRTCNAYTNKNYKFYKENKDKKLNALIELVQQQIELRLSVVVMIISEDNIDKTIFSLLNQDMKPNQVLFVFNCHTILPQDIHPKLLELIGNRFTWRMCNIVERNDVGGLVSPERALDIIINQIKGNYFTLLKSGQELPKDFIYSINHSLNEEVKQFIMLKENTNGVGLTIQTNVYKHPMVNGNVPAIGPDENGNEIPPTAFQRIIKFANETGHESFIKEVGEICSSLL